VLRDFDNRGNNFQKIKTIIDQDVANIWRDIYKPDQFKNSKPEEFFAFDYFTLPHMQFEEEEFYK
jgi:hypothetical protein